MESYNTNDAQVCRGCSSRDRFPRLKKKRNAFVQLGVLVQVKETGHCQRILAYLNKLCEQERKVTNTRKCLTGRLRWNS